MCGSESPVRPSLCWTLLQFGQVYRRREALSPVPGALRGDPRPAQVLQGVLSQPPAWNFKERWTSDPEENNTADKFRCSINGDGRLANRLQKGAPSQMCSLVPFSKPHYYPPLQFLQIQGAWEMTSRRRGGGGISGQKRRPDEVLGSFPLQSACRGHVVGTQASHSSAQGHMLGIGLGSDPQVGQAMVMGQIKPTYPAVRDTDAMVWA